MNIKTYGKSGHGFSIDQGSIQHQVNKAGKHDLYILWASTNDFTTNQSIGEATDYTMHDGSDEAKRHTQCGGINYCIKKLREINPDCQIYLFTSLKFFGNIGQETYGYEIIPKTIHRSGVSLFEYTRKQIECALLQGIPYFDQWIEQEEHINEDNFRIYYKEDGSHMTEYGYFDIGIRQLLFLAQQGKQ